MKILLFGNSGSGKSTLAKQLSEQDGLAHLDLDTIAWRNVVPPQRAPLSESEHSIRQFTNDQECWVIEGCYSDLLQLATPCATKMIYLNLPITTCIENARNRPWEPHKYASKTLQDENLPMLINWITDYESREDTFSRQAHLQLFNSFSGQKVMYTTNAHEAAQLDA